MVIRDSVCIQQTSAKRNPYGVKMVIFSRKTTKISQRLKTLTSELHGFRKLETVPPGPRL